jgi:hypothetical protein
MTVPDLGLYQKLILIALATGLLGAFAYFMRPPQPAHSVAWFMQHPQERTEALRRCNEMPSDPKQDANCVNAMTSADTSQFLAPPSL